MEQNMVFLSSVLPQILIPYCWENYNFKFQVFIILKYKICFLFTVCFHQYHIHKCTLFAIIYAKLQHLNEKNLNKHSPA